MAKRDSTDFWTQSQITCRELSQKCKYTPLTEEEALMHAQLCRMLNNYFKLQRLVIDRDINIIELHADLRKEAEKDNEE